MKTLYQMYKIYNPSYGESVLSAFVQIKLDKMRIKYDVLGNGTIYSFKPSTPLICAHLDSVQEKPVTAIKHHRGMIYGNGNLGADDKNGVWACLQLVKQHRDVSFLFSVQEEVGGCIDGLLDSNDGIMDKMLYGLVFDRRNGSDIVCNNNLYGSKRFEKQLSRLGKKYGYKPATGTWSDADAISEYMSCANLSVGYYMAHSKTEYTQFPELVNAVKYGNCILSSLKKRYAPVFKTRYSYKSPIYDSYTLDGFTKYYKPMVDDELTPETTDNPDYLWVCVDCNQYYKESDLIRWDYCPICGGFLVDEYYRPRNEGSL